MANLDLIRETIAAIEQDEEHWNQEHFIDIPSPWSTKPLCDTTLCFAGWACLTDVGAVEFFNQALRVATEPDSGQEFWASGRDIEPWAQDILDLKDSQAEKIFYATGIKEVATLKKVITEALQVQVWDDVPIPAQDEIFSDEDEWDD